MRAWINLESNPVPSIACKAIGPLQVAEINSIRLIATGLVHALIVFADKTGRAVLIGNTVTARLTIQFVVATGAIGDCIAALNARDTLTGRTREFTVETFDSLRDAGTVGTDLTGATGRITHGRICLTLTILADFTLGAWIVFIAWARARIFTFALNTHHVIRTWSRIIAVRYRASHFV
jgi:hypothetical protein